MVGIWLARASTPVFDPEGAMARMAARTRSWLPHGWTWAALTVGLLGGLGLLRTG